jgi:hypothetical protein
LIQVIEPGFFALVPFQHGERWRFDPGRTLGTRPSTRRTMRRQPTLGRSEIAEEKLRDGR